MFDVDRILAIPDQSIDYLQCGIAGKERAALEARGFIRKDGTKAKDYMIRTIQKTAKNKEKAVIKGDKKLPVKLSKPAKSLNQKSDQAYRLHEQTKAKVEKLKDKLSDLYDEGSKLQDRLEEAKSKVESGRTKKASSTQKDIGKFAASLQSELANGGQPVPIMRQKGNKKQIAELDDKINENFNQRIALQSQVKRLQSRAGKLLDASQDYADKASRATTKSNRGLEVTYNKKGDLSSAATAAKAKKAISGQAKGGKVVKGVKPSDRGKNADALNRLQQLADLGKGETLSDKKAVNSFAKKTGRDWTIEKIKSFSAKSPAEVVSEYSQKLGKDFAEYAVRDGSNHWKDTRTGYSFKLGDAIKNDLSRHDMARESLGLPFLNKPKGSKPIQPSATAKKLGISAEKETDILKRLKKY